VVLLKNFNLRCAFCWRNTRAKYNEIKLSFFSLFFFFAHISWSLPAERAVEEANDSEERKGKRTDSMKSCQKRLYQYIKRKLYSLFDLLLFNWRSTFLMKLYLKSKRSEEISRAEWSYLACFPVKFSLLLKNKISFGKSNKFREDIHSSGRAVTSAQFYFSLRRYPDSQQHFKKLSSRL